MDFADPPEVARFRSELRDWLAREAPGYRGTTGFHCAQAVARTRQWYRALAAAGYVGVSLPASYGGRGLSDSYEAVVNEELAAARAPASPPVGHIAHAIADFASEDLKRRLLPGLLGCTESWCQGFSEPEAGSDLASLRTTAQRVAEEGMTAQRVAEEGTTAPGDGDAYLVNGQKIWTSGAMWAQWCLLLARTEPGQPRHRGLSMLAVDMTSPGIERREITLANGSSEFAEVFFDDVRVPASLVVGEPGQGWRIAMHMLTYERGPADMGWVGRLGQALGAALDGVRLAGERPDEPLRRAVARSAAEIQVLQWHIARSLASRDAADPGPAGSLDKLLTTRVEQRLYRVLADLAGASFVLDDEPFAAYLWARAQSVYGGTQQIQRQIVAERLLGLPRG